MQLGFILGRAGTGKTEYILNEIRQTVSQSPLGAPVILLVPEQATFQMEYSLAGSLSQGGSIRAQVLSFRRLAHRVLLEVGGATRKPIGELGKRMVLRNLVEGHKEALSVFGKSIMRTGFTDRIARSIGEMKTYLVTPDMLNNAAENFQETSVLLHQKLGDLSLLYQSLEDYLASRYTDPDDYLKLLAEKIPYSTDFSKATFWIDGFKGFTPLELLVVKSLFRVSEKVKISLCLDCDTREQELYDDDLFYPTWETFNKITRIAVEQGVTIDEPVLLKPEVPYRFVDCPEVTHLEKHYFRYPALEFEAEPQNLKIIAGANKRAEVEACAREIIAIIRDNGYRWKNIAVLLRNLEDYSDLISVVFRDHRVPFFIDQKRNVLHHPVVELIRSALETVYRNWSYEPVFRYLKTDLVPVDRDRIFSLENYVLAHGIKGAKWLEEGDWSYRKRYNLGDDSEVTASENSMLEAINETRRAASCHLSEFYFAISAAGNVRQMTAALFSLLDKLQVAESLDNWQTECEASGNPEMAREHAQVWAQVSGLLDEVVEALGDSEVTPEVYAEVLDAGFESMNIGLIPPGLDQVIVGTLDRSRSPRVKAAFLLGASEGTLPARPADDGLFNDQEREKLLALGLDLAPGSRRQVFEEQFLVYTALTRASEKLWISYPLADSEGQAISPSPVVGRIQELIPAVKATIMQVEPITGNESEDIEFLADPDRVIGYLAAKLRGVRAGGTIENFWWQLYNWFIKQEQRAQASTILRGVFHQNTEKPIPRHLSRTLYGHPIKASVSRIEKFKSCPFAHFSTYGLSLKERKIYRLDAPDMGELFHAALQRFVEELQVQSIDWGQLSPDDCSKINKKIVDELAPQLQSEILLSTARYRYLTGKLKKTIDRATIVLAQHARQSQFRPLATELSFGLDGQLPPLSIQLPGGDSLELRGRIDRLDMARSENGVYLRVIDYKSSDTRIRLEDIYYGLRIQLLTYLHVALSFYSGVYGVPVLPGGILYFTVKEPLINTPGPVTTEAAEKAILGRLKMRGFLLADADVFKMMDSMVETGYSNLFPVGLKKDGTFYSNSPVLDLERWEILRSYLTHMLTESGGNILQGVVDIEPYRTGNSTACTFCSYKSVCKFDTLLEDNNFKVLPAISPEELRRFGTGEGD